MRALVALLAAPALAAPDAGSDAALDLLSQPLTSATIEQVVKSRISDLQRCYELALEKKEGAEGTVVLTWTITREGTVKDVKTKSSTAKSPQVGSCFREAVKTWSFPRPKDGRPQPVEYPFRMRLIR